MKTEADHTINPVPAMSHGQGLTKREYFAGQALIGMMAYVNKPMDADTIATESVRLADALIKPIRK